MGSSLELIESNQRTSDAKSTLPAPYGKPLPYGTFSNIVGFKADFLGEVLHSLRHRASYTEYITIYGQILGTRDVRERNAIERLAAGYFKLLFPDFQLSYTDYNHSQPSSRKVLRSS